MRILRKILFGFVFFIGLAYVGLIAYAYWPSGIEEVPAKTLAAPEDRFVDINGLQLRYRTWGTPGPDKPNLVLVHGFGNSLQSFRLLGPLLQNDYYVVALDLPGFGLSDKPVDYEYRNSNQASTVGAFIRELGIKDAVIGGHSLGGAVALHVAVNEPGIGGLLLINPGIINTGVPAITQYLPFPFQRLSAKQFGDRDFRKRFLKVSYMRPEVVTDEVIDNLMLATQSEGYLAGSTAMMSFYEPAREVEMLPDVDVPTIILWGAKDRNKNPAELARLVAGLSEGLGEPVVIEVADSGHYVHEEGAEESATGLIARRSVWN